MNRYHTVVVTRTPKQVIALGSKRVKGYGAGANVTLRSLSIELLRRGRLDNLDSREHHAFE